MPTEIELLFLAWANVRKNLGGDDRDVPPYDDTIADALDDMDAAMDQLRQMFEEPENAYAHYDVPEPVET